MDLVHPKVNEYLRNLASHGDPILEEMEQRAQRDDFPIIGPAVGQLCYQVTRMLKARRVFELGSGYGYSTLWFAKAVRDNGGGEIFHNVWDEQLSKDAQAYIERASLSAIVSYRVSEAVKALRESDGTFDIIFNDINSTFAGVKLKQTP